MAYTGAQPSYVNFPVDYFSGNGSTTSFNLTYPASAEGSVLVSVNNQHIYVNKYTVNNRSLVFNGYVPPAGTNNIEVIYLGIPSISENVQGVTSVGIASDLSGITVTNSPIITAGVMRLGGILGVSNGGTGQSTLGQYSVLLGNNANGIQSVSTLGSSNQVLTSQGTGASPTWTSVVNSFSAGTTGLTPGGVNTGAITLSGTLVVANGGTGVVTIPLNRVVLGNGTNPLTTVAGSGNASQVLTSQGANNAPIWVDVPVKAINAVAGLGLTLTNSSGNYTLGGTLSLSNGGTNSTSFVSASVIASNTAGTALISLGTGTTGQVLTSNGTGNLPTWQNVGASIVNSFSAGTTGLTPSTASTGAITLGGTLSISNGGTNSTSYTANTVVVANSTNTALVSLANGTAGQVLTMVSNVPTWITSPTNGAWFDAVTPPINGIFLGVYQQFSGGTWNAFSNPTAGNVYTTDNTTARVVTGPISAVVAGSYRSLGSFLNSGNALWVRIS